MGGVFYNILNSFLNHFYQHEGRNMKTLTYSIYRHLIKTFPARVIRFLTVMSLWTYFGKLTNKSLINPLTLGRMNNALHLASKNDALMVGVYSYKLQIDDELKSLTVKREDGTFLSSVSDLISKKNITREEFNSLALTVADFIISNGDNKYTKDRNLVIADVCDTLIVGSVVTVV
jgi:hypothetical protein